MTDNEAGVLLEFEKAINFSTTYHLHRFKLEFLGNARDRKKYGCFVVPVYAVSEVTNYLKSLKGEVIYETRPCGSENTTVVYAFCKFGHANPNRLFERVMEEENRNCVAGMFLIFLMITFISICIMFVIRK